MSAPSLPPPICDHFEIESFASEHIHSDHPIYINNENTAHDDHIETPSHFSALDIEN
jgi:hypothetical protein